MEIRLLGSVEVHHRGQVLDIGPPRQRCVLGALAMDVGRPVRADTIVDRVWGEAPPSQVRQSLYVYIARIRQVIGDIEPTSDGSGPRVIRRSGGYLLDVDPDHVDVHRFSGLVAQASDPRCADQHRATLLRQALALGRGTPLANVSGLWAEQVRERLRRQWLDTAVAWARAELGAGNPAAVVHDLTAMVAEFPLVEPLTAALMSALYANGRAAEALDCYATIRRRLADELGADPSSELQQVYQTILRAEPGPAPSNGTATPSPPTRPAQLPGDTLGFTGREAELAHLNALMAERTHRATTVVISGTAGVGKTSLAVHWAHHASERFPDGQLFLDLRGFDPIRPPISPDQAIPALLDALVARSERIPPSLQAKTGLLRSLLATRQLLIVLDNARDADQVRPLLPGTTGSLVIVTSRHRMSGLSVSNGAHSIILDTLSDHESRELLVARLGARRVAAEPEATDDIVARCDRLPLALAIVAARAACHPTFPLNALATELRHDEHRLDALTDGDAATDIRAAFSVSYQTLTEPAARLFRLLGQHPGPHVSTPAVASLAGLPLPAVLPLLAELERANLVTQSVPSRYVLHDLLREFAAELAGALDSDAERHAAMTRTLDHYLYTAYDADLLLYPHRYRFPLPPVGPDVPVLKPVDHEQAMAWFVAEHPTLLAVVDHAYRHGFDTHTWQLAWTMAVYLDRRGHWGDQLTTNTAGLAAARRAGDRVGQAYSNHELASASNWIGKHDDAHVHYDRSQRLFHALDDRVGEAHCHLNRSLLYEQQDRYTDALRHAQCSLDLFQACAHRSGLAKALNAVGWYQAVLGQHAAALANCERAIELLRELGDRYGEACTWDSLGYVHHLLIHHADAVACYQHAVNLWRELGDRRSEVSVLHRLGDAYLAAGNPAQARDTWLHALGVHAEITHPEAPQIRRKVALVSAQRGADA